MSSGFKRLRVVAAAGLGGAALVPLAAGPAAAAVQNLPAVHTGIETDALGTGFGPSVVFHRFSHWAVSNGFAWPSAPSSNGYGFTSVGRTTSVQCSSNPCGGTGTGDVVFGVTPRVNGKMFRNPDGTIDVTGPTFNSDHRTVNGLDVQVRHDFFGMDDKGNSITRVLVTLTNHRDKTLHRTVQMGAFIGTGSGTSVDDTSSGDSTYSRDDAWLLMNDSNNEATLIAKGDAARSTIDQDPEGSGEFVDNYRLAIGANSTVRLLYYAATSPIFQTGNLRSIDQHFNNALQLSSHGLLSGLSARQKSQIVNWRNVH